VFTGRYHEVAKQKQWALDERFKSNPERFVRGKPSVQLPPKFVAINPLTKEENGGTVISDRVNFPTLSAAGYVSGK